MQALTAGDQAAVLAVANAYAPVDGPALAPLMRHMRVVQLRRGEPLLRTGDAVLRAELMRRADREWALAALSAQERLLACRTAWPELESLVPHRHLASYLGITPVSLSRLRAKLR